VVGIDVADHAHTGAAWALDWAAAEAAAQRRPLRIVHVVQPWLCVGLYRVGLARVYQDRSVPDLDPLSEVSGQAERVLRQARDRVRAIAPEIAVSIRPVIGSAVRVLRRETLDASMLVLGQRDPAGRRQSRRLFAGSVCAQLAAHAHCPIVVMPPAPDVPGPRSAPRVVVGIDTPHDRILRFAFRAARQRGISLTAVRALPPSRRPGEAAHHIPDPGEQANRSLQRALARWHAHYPDVCLTTRVARSERADALVGESRGAALLILSSSGGAHQPRSEPSGAANQDILRRAHSPIAVVHSRVVDRGRPRWSRW
jgi:nucleotide-binding universal stress UspA family protein